MPWPVYSERFLKVAGATPPPFVVPAGHRAVVTCITVANWSGVVRQAQVLLADVTVFRVSLPGDVFSRIQELRTVAYQGEQLVGAVDGADMYLTVSGYLLRDVTGRVGPPASASSLPAPPEYGPPVWGD